MEEQGVKFRNLDKVRFFMQEATGLDVAYAYDDLVFSEHGLFIIRFRDDDEDAFYVYFNKDCVEAKKKLILTQLVELGKMNKVKMVYKGKFEMEQKEGIEEIELKLYEA